jgi:hypothetical protein
MDGVHYGAASALLVVLVVVGRRVLRLGGAADVPGDMSTPASDDQEVRAEYLL